MPKTRIKPYLEKTVLTTDVQKGGLFLVSSLGLITAVRYMGRKGKKDCTTTSRTVEHLK